MALFGCEGDTTNNTYQSAPTALKVTVNPAGAYVTLTGPASFPTQTFNGNKTFTDLAAGQYTAKATYPGYVDATGSINVVTGVTSDIQLVLQPTDAIINAPRVVVRGDNGQLIPLDETNMQDGHFVFYAWLQDLPSGIIVTSVTSTGDPGPALVSEQTETAPSFTQNLAGAYVGFVDSKGVERAVIGADVRWEIDQQYAARLNSMQFGTSDDNRIAGIDGINYGIKDDQADTRTNNARLVSERYPLIATDYPLYNLSGVGTPTVDGFTWVTLFSPDAKAKGRIVAVATINGEEIGKQILYKNFAPKPNLHITKTVDQSLVNVGDTVTWTITVTNTGSGDATTVNLNDFLVGGATTSYATIALPPGSTVNADDGFTYTFPLIAAAGAPPAAPILGNAQSFAVLSNTSVSNTGSSVVTGNVGISAGTSIIGFPPGIILSGTKHIADATALAAQNSLANAFVNLKAMPATETVNTPLSDGILTPGVYPYDSSASLVGPLVLDAQGDPNAVFVFQITSALTTASGSNVSLINGASPCNVYWVLDTATLGTNSAFVGNILAQSSITANTGASISGRALARVGAVSLDTNVVNAPLSCVAAPLTSTQTLTFTASASQPGTYCNEAQILSYFDGTSTVTVNINDQACFTAVSPILSIVKDFVADDNTTSLGKTKTVAANVPAKLRVRVINSGTGDATNVQVSDAFSAALSSGLFADYRVVSATSPTNIAGGFDAAPIATLAAGTTSAPMFVTVSASVDATYCDTATYTADGPLTGDDSACLTVATPVLEITKSDAPASVLPGATYTSTIVVTNTGTATANNVVISDLLGKDTAANIQAIYISSSLNGASGTLAGNVVTANSVVSLAANETLTFTVVSRIPLGAAAGTNNYCDTATVTSSNADTKQATACVSVPAFSALQTQLVDIGDPVAKGGNISFYGTLYVEAQSNEGVHNNVLTLLYGHANALDLVSPGVFSVTSMNLYVDSAPVRDPITGLVVSGPSSPTAVLQTAGTDYTVTTVLGKQVITMTPSVTLQPNTAIYVVSNCLVPAATATGQYTTSYIWDSIGGASTIHYQASSSEPSTVLP
jgi:uncharacterized repeat protein (TIGR01451 family)